jgi:hypothetical protein
MVMPPEWLARWISISQGIIQIAFFVTTGLLAVLSYLRAKKTLFQPLRTEVFKEQLKLLTKILVQFEGKGEGALQDDFGINEIIKINTTVLLQAYASVVFGKRFQAAEQPHLALRHMHLMGSPKDFPADHGAAWGGTLDPSSTRQSAEDLGLQTPKWDQYRHFCLYLPEKNAEMNQKLKRLIDSPLVPSPCLKLLRDYTGLSKRKIEHIQTVLTEIAPTLSEHYPTLKDLEKADLGFFHNLIINRTIETLAPTAKEIINFARGYLEPDRFFK